MADQAAPVPGPVALMPTQSAPAPNSITNTTAIAFGTTGGAGIILWIFACIQAGHIVPPDNGVALAMAATLAPLVHAIGRALTARLNRIAGVPNA